MQEVQITCKIHDSQQRVVFVGAGSSKYSVQQVWDWIKSNQYSFYTYAKGKKAIVKAQVSSTGRKYLTTHPDGITDNNLDELPPC